MNWRVARSLDTLLNQLNAAFPNRSKASDGAVGDTNHLAEGWTASDHNPWYPLPNGGIVTARDYTHDPAHGLDIDRLSDELASSRDYRIKYVIANGYILDTRPQFNPWQWVKYTGNPHDHHLHLSVVAAVACDDPKPWNLPMLQEGDGMKSDERDALFDVRAQLAGVGPLGKYVGWPAHPDTTTDAKTMVDYVRALHAEQRAQRAILDEIRSKLK